jgi:hypothetical protein
LCPRFPFSSSQVWSWMRMYVYSSIRANCRQPGCSGAKRCSFRSPTIQPASEPGLKSLIFASQHTHIQTDGGLSSAPLARACVYGKVNTNTFVRRLLLTSSSGRPKLSFILCPVDKLTVQVWLYHTFLCAANSPNSKLGASVCC